jgi:oligopeptide transport system substrate-binding protein
MATASVHPIHGRSLAGRRSGAALYLALLCTMLAGCSPNQSSVETGNRAGILYFGNGTEPQSIDPHVLSGSPERTIAVALFEGLVTRNPYSLEIEPGVARHWEISEDGLTLRFHLREDARWSNGDPLTAEDFVWSWQRALLPRMGNQLALWLFSIRNAEKINRGLIDDPAQLGARAVDAHTLEVTLEHPDPFALIKLSYIYCAPVHRPTIEAHGEVTSRYSGWTRPGNFVGNGPFVLDEWKIQRYVRVKRNPHYWDRDNVALNGIVFRPVENASTEEKMFRSGQLHTTTMVPNAKIPGYRLQPDSPYQQGPLMGIYYFMMNVNRPPLDDQRVRRALAISIDRDRLASSVLMDTVIPTSTYVPHGMPDYHSPEILSFNPQQARTLLAEAGYPGGTGFPQLELIYNTSENHRTVAIAVQQMWKDVLGIEVTLANQEWKVYLDRVDSKDFDIARMGWTGDLYPGVFLDPLVSDGDINMMGFSHPSYDRIIQQEVRRTHDKSSLLRLYEKAERILLETTPLIPVYTDTEKRLTQPSLEGLPSNPSYVYNFKYVRLDPTAAAWQWHDDE